ncbi:hypothetical protein [Leptolyngbya sp. FACHB-261]|uniref:hypothetical protein n=1 Tax=Leptolyngbya sp. FACHB-261 TaxID=2692806 RepID=UPI001689B418|nr:hypothetical protein [Leptolyngbya sp. FACHB-261]
MPNIQVDATQVGLTPSISIASHGPQRRYAANAASVIFRLAHFGNRIFKTNAPKWVRQPQLVFPAHLQLTVSRFVNLDPARNL